ncbi:hypothetical protein EV421DRAFT_1735849 [Armillaria borealis]|uniref:Uncharacterized protein n=1 Tax=Armillaria borealis TaxID=47425 RepID=A0AA39JK57_9AGAR|nr:hypothetical protein EV421DRAFT_1735849 [Armillaria borealis]
MKLKVTNDQFSSAQTTKHLTSADSETMGHSFAYHLTFVKLPIALCSSLMFFLAPSTTSLVTMMMRTPNSRAFAKKDFMEEPDLLVETAEWVSPAHVGSVKLVSDAAKEINLVEDLITEHIQHLCIVLESTKTVIPTQDKTLWNEILRLKERAALDELLYTSTSRSSSNHSFALTSSSSSSSISTDHCYPSRSSGVAVKFLFEQGSLEWELESRVVLNQSRTSGIRRQGKDRGSNSSLARVEGELEATQAYPHRSGDRVQRRGQYKQELGEEFHSCQLSGSPAQYADFPRTPAVSCANHFPDTSREAGRYASTSKALGKGHLMPNIFRSFTTVYKQVHHDHTEGHEFSLSSTANAFSWGARPLQLSARLAAHLNDVERTCSWMSGDQTFAASPYVWDVIIPSSKLKLDCTLHLTKVPEFYPTWSTCIEILASIAL